MSNSLWHHGLQHARLPCPSPTPRACSNSCLSNQWPHPTISSSVVPFSSCLLSFPSSGSFPMSQFFTSDGQSIGVSASASVLPKVSIVNVIRKRTNKNKVKLLRCVQLFATLWTVAYQGPPSMGFSRQEYWSGLPFPSPGDLPDPGTKPGSNIYIYIWIYTYIQIKLNCVILKLGQINYCPGFSRH